MKKIDTLLLGALLVLAIALRMYHITYPLADWHSWRQADTAAVARNFVDADFNIFLPRFDDFSNVQSSIYNPEGYRMVEFPLYNSATALLHMAAPSLPIEVAGRIISIIFSLIIISIVYYLLLKEHSRIAAMIGGLIFSTFPFFVYYSRVVLPDMTALGCGMISIYLLYMWSQKKETIIRWICAISSLVFFACALLIKPTTIFFAPALAYLFFRNYHVKTIKSPIPYLFFGLSIIPLVLWRIYITQYPAGIPLSKWLFTSVNTSLGLQEILLRPSFFRWVFLERISILILGGYALVLVIMGITRRPKNGYFLLTLPFCALCYLLIFEGCNVQHDYYQIMILPALAICAGLGGAYLLQSSKAVPHRIFNSVLVVSILLSSWYFSYKLL